MNLQSLMPLYKKPVSYSLGIGFFLLFIISCVSLKAQTGKLPPFRMFQENNTIFKAEQLPLGKPILLIYFLPDCDHCQLLTKNIAEHIDVFEKFSVVMITYYPKEEVGKFSKRYGLDKHTNFYWGTEGNSYYLKHYYNLSKLPFAAIYDKNGNLVKKYNSGDFFDDLFKEIKNFPKAA